MRLFLALAFLAASCWPTAGLAAPLSAAFDPPAIIDISSLRPFLDTLPPDEKAEQLRDWALYGVRSLLALTSPGEMPIRHPALKETLPGEVSPGRVFPLTSAEWGLVVAPELLENRPLLGGLIDEKYATSNYLPEIISLFTYTVDPAVTTIRILFAGSIPAKELFTQEYGYHSATISTLTDFTDFAAHVDDVVSFRWQARSVSLGGRKYLGDGQRSLTVEEIAGLYQAFNAPVATGKSPAPPQPAEIDMGFSLDHRLNYPAFADDLKGIASIPGVAEESADPDFAALLSRHHAELIAIGERLKKQHDLRPFLALRRRFEGSPIAAEARLNGLLRYIEGRNAYQAARYEGKLQGTSVAMILFYTDLLAKLWTLDYGGMTPRSVVGFRSMREIKVPKLYWYDYLRLSTTRLWFGLRQEGFEFYGNNILFKPGVTRVYAASSDPLFPGKESLPNYQSREFLGWWDSHYEAMAAAEPYYHKLDQIQKWSCIFMVLQENNSHLLDFLQSVPVRRNLDFTTWINRDTTMAKIRIPFLDRRQYGSTTECLPLLASNSFPLMGRPYILTGGVSLASRQDILAKMRKHNPNGNIIRVQLPKDHSAGAGSATEARSGSEKSSAPKPPTESSRPRAPWASQGKHPTSTVAAGNRRISARNHGTFAAEKGPGRISLRWTKGPALAPHELVAALATWQEANPHDLASAEILSGIADLQSAVRLKERAHYLVKTAISQDEWVYLAVNPAKTDAYPAKAAGDFPEADIFCARLISGGDARKLAAAQPVVR
ncbi:MAG: hypothetical protein HGA96_07890 [Desulfobulbaceae bacterium]|nr:hypothetical protein [Desulfobulbaceae bacterium]